MILSRVSIRRPVLATVLNLLLIVLGIGALFQLPVREYPDIDPPVVTLTTVYPGASAAVVDRDVTETIEDSVSSISGINSIVSTSRNEVSSIQIEFDLNRDLNAAASDVRDKLDQVRAELPNDVDPPVISKTASSSEPIMWLTLISETRDRLELTDFADRTLVDPLSIVPGVAQVIIGGGRTYAMRIWLDRQAMAARGVTVQDVVSRLQSQNLELPAGRIESDTREFTVRATTRLADPEAFRELVLRDQDGYQVTLGQVARVEIGAEDYRTAVRVDGEAAVGLGVIRQSKSNTLNVAEGIRNRLDELRPQLPDDISIQVSYDASVFIQGSIEEVLKTLAITGCLVIAVIFLFLASPRTVLIPAATIPVSLTAALMLLWLLGFSINVLTLLALVLATGLVVDDAIVVLENIFRRNQEGEERLLAAAKGADQIGLAVVATTLVLVSVFVPLAFLPGDTGRLFTEFAVTLAAAVAFSSFTALTLGAMLASKLVNAHKENRLSRLVNRGFGAVIRGYRKLLGGLLKVPVLVVGVALVASVAVWFLYQTLPKELAPTEDRGTIIIPVQAPEGSTLAYTREAVEQIETLLQSYQGEDGPVEGVLGIIGVGRQGPGQVDEAIIIVKLKPWGERDTMQQALAGELMGRLQGVAAVRAFAVNPPSLGQQGFSQPVQVAVGGPDFEAAQDWARQLLGQARQVSGLSRPQLDYQETVPQIQVTVDRRSAADLGVSVRDVAQTLQVLFGGTDVTEFVYRARTYEVIPRAEAQDRATVADLQNVHVRSDSGELVSLRDLVQIETRGAPNALQRVNRSPSVVLNASLAQGAALGDVLNELETIADEQLPQGARLNYLGRSKEYRESSSGVFIAFGLALVIVYLVLAGQFESFIHPITIMVPVPLAITGGLLALWLLGLSFNIYSQIALILLIGIMAKNAILVVEFANQLRDEGRELKEAILEAAAGRLRPVLMTSIATTCGALPLALAVGPGAEGRTVIGVVMIGGTILATLLTLFVVPGLYLLLGRFTGRAGAIGDRLAELENKDRSRLPADGATTTLEEGPHSKGTT